MYNVTFIDNGSLFDDFSQAIDNILSYKVHSLMILFF